MNVILEEPKENKKLKTFYIIIIVICILAIIFALVIQMTKNETPTSIPKLPEVSDSDIGKYKDEFNKIFENEVKYLENNSYKITKIKQDKEIVYMGYQNKESKINDFELDVNIPYINIQNTDVEEFNTQIRDIFEQKVKSILNTQNNNVIYVSTSFRLIGGIVYGS